MPFNSETERRSIAGGIAFEVIDRLDYKLPEGCTDAQIEKLKNDLSTALGSSVGRNGFKALNLLEKKDANQAITYNQVTDTTLLNNFTTQQLNAARTVITAFEAALQIWKKGKEFA